MWTFLKTAIKYIVGIYVFFFLLLYFTDSSSSSSNQTFDTAEFKKSVNEKVVDKLETEDCVEFIQLLSIKQVAKEYDATEMWVVQNYKVNVWEKTSARGKGKKVGEMHAGSRALLLERSGDDFKIKSPKDKSVGWVNSIQIDKTLYQNPKTYEECKE